MLAALSAAFEDLRSLLPQISSDLRIVVSRMELDLAKESGIDANDFESSGRHLILLAETFWMQLSDANHTVLSASLRDAGLGLSHRSCELRDRVATGDDRRFYSEVCDALADMLKSMDSGEYVAELEKLRIALSK